MGRASVLVEKAVLPLRISPFTLQLVALVLLTTKVNVFVAPIATLPKARLVGLTFTAQFEEIIAPRPENVIVVEPALSLIDALPVSSPPVGIKLKLRFVVAPGGSTIGNVTAGRFVKSGLPV